MHIIGNWLEPSSIIVSSNPGKYPGILFFPDLLPFSNVRFIGEHGHAIRDKDPIGPFERWVAARVIYFVIYLKFNVNQSGGWGRVVQR